MFCPYCGAELPQGAAICPKCGCATAVKPPMASPAQPFPARPTYMPVPQPDTGNVGWWFLGFFFPLVGLILFLVWKDTKPLSAKRVGWGALVGVIVEVVLAVIITVISLFAIGLFARTVTADYPWSEFSQFENFI